LFERKRYADWTLKDIYPTKRHFSHKKTFLPKKFKFNRLKHKTQNTKTQKHKHKHRTQKHTKHQTPKRPSMQHCQSIFCIITALFFHQTTAAAASVDTVHIKDITALTLAANTWTTASRLAPIQQLQCIGGDAMDMAHHVRLVQCVKVGSNGGANQWKCDGNFPADLRIDLERTDVTCEGYRDRTDPYKVVGSCGLLYTLVRLPSSNDNYYDYDAGGRGTILLFNLCLLICVVVVVVTACTIGCGNGDGYRNSEGGGGGGYRNGGYQNGGGGYNTSSSFLSGAATGVAASSLWNNRNSGWASSGHRGRGGGRASSGGATRKSTGVGTTIDR
jgi:hypothetical protein